MSSSNAPLVGLVGYAQAGKDTFAKYMTGFTKLAFAGVLRDFAYDSNPWYREQIQKHGYEYAKTSIPGVREYLQDAGMAVREYFGADTWIKAAFEQHDPTRPTVITDTRFPNEIAAIKERGGIIIRIDRQGHAPANTHISEHAWQATNPDEHYTFANGALRHMELVAVSVAGRLTSA